jgi:hypothetical protein
LSINKISQELNYKIIFSSKKVFFQDQMMGNIIGKRFLENRLCILEEENDIINVRKEELGILWHKRIRHPSDKILKSIFYFKKIDCSACEVFKLEKHTNLSFIHSICKSIKPF